jgi:hypothetical protein
VRRGWLRRAVDLDDVAIRIEEEELGVTGRAVAADKNTKRVILRRVFAKTAGSQRGEGVVEIISAESKMAIVVIDIAGPEGAGRINGQMQLSRCTKLGDLENMDRFVALNWGQSKRIALN